MILSYEHSYIQGVHSIYIKLTGCMSKFAFSRVNTLGRELFSTIHQEWSLAHRNACIR
jgi:hypothetical protein